MLLMPNELRNPRAASNITAVLVLVISLVLLYWPTWVDLANKWVIDSESYSHGYLIALTSLVLLIQSAINASQLEGRLRCLAVAGVLVAGTMWLAAYLSNIFILQAALLPIIFLLAVASVFGVPPAWVYVFPVTYFYFAIPVWNYLTGTFQAMTIEVTAGFLGLLRIPAAIEGSFVFLPSGTFEIASGCSGLNFFIVGSALGTFYAQQYLRSRKFRFLIVGVTIALTLLMNWIRVTIIVVAGYLTEMQHYLVTVDHYKFGWFLFVLMLVPLYFIGRFFEKQECRQGNSLNERPNYDEETLAPSMLAGRIAISVLILSVAPLTGVVLDQRVDQINHASLIPPRSVGDWRWQPLPATVWQPRFLGAEQEAIGQYVLDDEHIELYINLYTRQRQGAELIGSSNSLFDDDHWREESRSTIRLEMADGKIMSAKLLEVANREGRRQFYVYWYLVGDNVLVNAFKVKFYELAQRLRGRAASSIVAVRIECRLDCEFRREKLLDFLSMHSEAINVRLSRLLTSDVELMLNGV